jgi:hypothetical protein
MPGAGSSTVAFVPESSYNTTPGSPTYYNPGTNVEFQDISLERNLTRLKLPGSVEDDDAIAQRLDGGLAVSFVPTSDDFHRIVFNDSNTGFTSGNAASAEWYLAVEQPDGTVDERQIQGWAPTSMEVSYNGSTENTRVTLTGFYAEEDTNASVTPGSITNNSTGDEVPGHGAEFKFDSTKVSKLNSATLSLEGISRPQFGSTDPIVQAAVTGDINQSATFSGTWEGSTWLEYALGSSGASSVEDFVNSVSSTITLDHDGSTIADYSFTNAKPRNYNWTDLVNPEADLADDVEWWASSITASDPTV